MREETEDTLAIVGGDRDDALSRHRVASISSLASASSHQSSAIEIDQYGQMLFHRLGRSPYIKV